MILKGESVNVPSLDFVLKLEKCSNLEVILFEEALDLVPHFEWDVLRAERTGCQKILGDGSLRGLPQTFDFGQASRANYGRLED